MTIRYRPEPVIGYSEGLIVTTCNEQPAQIRTPNPDGKSSPLHDVVDDWFYIGQRRYNVHPFRADLGGWPVRWHEQVSEHDTRILP